MIDKIDLLEIHWGCKYLDHFVGTDAVAFPGSSAAKCEQMEMVNCLWKSFRLTDRVSKKKIFYSRMLYEYFQAYSFKISWMLWKILPEILRSELILKQNFEYVFHKIFFF